MISDVMMYDFEVHLKSAIVQILQQTFSYTLLFFGGRQPLCGMGVTSLMVATSIPF